MSEVGLVRLSVLTVAVQAGQAELDMHSCQFCSSRQWGQRTTVTRLTTVNSDAPAEECQPVRRFLLPGLETILAGLELELVERDLKLKLELVTTL